MNNNKFNIEAYRGLVDQGNETMKSTDLHRFVHEVTGKYKDIKDFHRAAKTALFGTSTPTKTEISDGVAVTPSFDARGYIQHFNLSEVECNIIMGHVDRSHRRLLAEVFVKVKNQHENYLPQQDRKYQLACKKLEAEEELLREDIMDKRVQRVRLLQSMGVNFDPVSLIDSGKCKSVLDKETSDALTDAYSDIRTGVKVFSATHLLNKNNIDIRTQDFNDAMIQADKMSVYAYRGTNYKSMTSNVNYYGYNRDASSLRELPYQVGYYEDRFTDLVQLLRNEGYID